MRLPAVLVMAMLVLRCPTLLLIACLHSRCMKHSLSALCQAALKASTVHLPVLPNKLTASATPGHCMLLLHRDSGLGFVDTDHNKGTS